MNEGERDGITKSEAALILNVSTRTIERLIAQGKLGSRRVRGKTRPRIMVERKEVEALRDQTGSPGPSRSGAASEKRPNDSIGFRLEPFYVRRLQALGEASGMSRGEVARRLVIQGIEDSSLSDALAEIRKLRQDFSETLYLLLIRRLGASEQEASDIVRSMLGRA